MITIMIMIMIMIIVIAIIVIIIIIIMIIIIIINPVIRANKQKLSKLNVRPVCTRPRGFLLIYCRICRAYKCS